MVGDGAAGKTYASVKYVYGAFLDTYSPTTFDTFYHNTTMDGENIQLLLMDTAGQEEFDASRPLSYPGADVVLMAFSLSPKHFTTSLQNCLQKWLPSQM